MKLYKISQDKNSGYDTYDSAVVAADSEDDARMIHPSPWEEDWEGKEDYDTWCPAEDVKVELIGEASPNIEKGAIVTSFNAG